VTPVVLCRKDSKKKKKSTRMLRPVEKVTERVVDAGKAMADKFASGFHSSARKKRDGWLRDLGSNLFKSANSGRKKLRIFEIPL
jgi:hypothetical protein